ncbi:MAG: DNA polymerase III subunit beta [Deltaproteobacteria bacterium]|nr:DNA polymerase III subunit beta [Deltaproteobacteria bacterium]
MKITMKTAELVKALYRVQGIADKNSTMPILSHVLLNATSNQLVVSATDMDVGVSGTYEAIVNSKGAAVIPARQLYEIIKSLNNETVELEKKENNWLEVISGASRFRLVGLAADEFPALPIHEQTNSFSLDTSILSKLIERTIFCVSSDDNRHNLSGVYCEAVDKNLLRLVATDGHRLALAEYKCDFNIPIERGVIMPRKGFQELKRVLADNSEKLTHVDLGFANNSGVIKAGSVVLSTRLIEGQFPNYTQVIPASCDKKAVINCKAFAEALRRVSLLSHGHAHGVRLQFTNEAVELVAEDPELGEAREQIQLSYDGTPISIGFNARYLLDVLTLIDNEEITLELIDDLSPAVLKPADTKGFLAVVMPMRI